MTKQEEIREGIVKRLNEFRRELQKPNALINAHTLVILQGAFADKILKDEDSQGVVIKVDKELPNVTTTDSPHYRTEAFEHGVRDYKEAVKNAGFIATEPLVGGIDGDGK